MIEWLLAHPFLAIVALWMVTNAAVEPVRAIRGKIAPPKATKKLREEVADLRDRSNAWRRNLWADRSVPGFRSGDSDRGRTRGVARPYSGEEEEEDC